MKNLSQPLKYQGVEVMTFRQLDQLNQMPKGTTFRQFKRRLHLLVEGEHYFRLLFDQHDALIAELVADGRLYPGVPNAVLITRKGYELMRT